MTFFNAPFNCDQFLADYWQKKPFLFRAAFPEITPLLPADEFAGLACEDEIEARIITQSSDHKSWQIQHGPFNDDVFARLPESHWTLLIQAVDHWLPEAAEFLTQFNFIPNWRIDDLMISYAADGGGVGPHFDHYDVFLIQASGQRLWQIGEQCDETSPRRSDTPVMILEGWQSEQEWLLKAGDMLYLPPQYSHNGVAVGDGCMTYSVGFRSPSISDIISGFSDHLIDQLSESSRYEDPNLTKQQNPGEISDSALKQIEKKLNDLMTDRNELLIWLGQTSTLPKYAEHAPDISIACTEKDISNHLAMGGKLYCSEGSRFAYHDLNEKRLFFVDGHTLECSRKMDGLIEILCLQRCVMAPEVTLDRESLSLLARLVQQTSLYPAE